jgi:glycosyltransferase involved in cell wall biosynthesis
MKTSVSAIIPCYNEGKRILPVIHILKKCPAVSEIIVVDDGSNQNTKKVLATLSGIKILTHPQNLGKSAAMKTGLLSSHSSHIAFFDADLIGLTCFDIKLLFQPVLSGEYDISVGILGKELSLFRKTGLSTMLSGERILRRKLLLNHLDLFVDRGYVNGFLIESRINQRFFGHNRIAKVNLATVGNRYKITKTGLKGFFLDLKVLGKIFRYLGFRETFRQLSFSRKLPLVS